MNHYVYLVITYDCVSEKTPLAEMFYSTSQLIQRGIKEGSLSSKYTEYILKPYLQQFIYFSFLPIPRQFRGSHNFVYQVVNGR